MLANWIIWGTLSGLCAVGFVALSRTQWLQSQTLRKCVLLSVAVHAALAVVAVLTGGMRPASWGRNDTGRMSMTVVVADEAADELSLPAAAPSVAEALDHETAVSPAVAAEPPSDHVPLLSVSDEKPAIQASNSTETAEAVRPPEAGLALSALSVGNKGTAPTPAMYADRVGARRTAAAAARGGTQDTERAVQSALSWLAASQSGDGRWNAARHGGGVERSLQGHYRQGAGAKSDHGVTGLALLALLGAGNTHLEGTHADAVSRGIRFLVERQRDNGSLAGDAEFFASLYCHGMATIALAETCAMTGDTSLRRALDRAIHYTLSMQSPATGGWRYAAGDRGDTSQLGWQVMALASSRHAGIEGLERAESQARVFLQSVSSGHAGGLAAYRAGERSSLAMTAEALVCRLFLGMPPDHPAVAEAVEMLGQSLPESASPNAYTWYYATLASFHAGGPQWERWNQRLQAAILPLQRRESTDLDGSWDPDPVWGSHGGRVYSTAMAAMTLEVYYRHLPMHRQASSSVARRP